MECTLTDVLIFACASSCIPPMGFFHKPTIYFLDDSILPTSSTCELTLRIPTVHKTYAKFKEYVVMGILCNDGFGTV